MKEPARYLITAALPYANGPLHLGHIAGAYLPADIYVRYLRLQGKDVAFICGSDEHGAAITLRAKKEGKTPREIVDHFHGLMKDTFADFGISFDVYHRTSSAEHFRMSQDIFLELLNNGSFTTETSKQYFDEEAGQFLADRYITGECPNCHNEKAYGDQCEKCGSSLSPLELINPKSTLSGSAPVLKETSHWYLPMEHHSEWIGEFISQGKLNAEGHHDPKEWKAHVLGQCMSWIDGGLHARAMTRDLDWGVPVPVEGADGKVLYVWLDAPIGYITNTKVWADQNGKNWEDYWKKDDTHLVHFIGKDNIVFHCIIFPIILKQHGGFVLPVNVPANEFMNLEGDKISTSRNWAVWLHEYLQDFPGKQDEMRYVLGSIMPEQKDSEFTWNDFKDRVNNELADILGNFVNRVFVLTHKYYQGIIPDPSGYELQEADRRAMAEARNAFESCGAKIEQYRFREALAEAMNIARAGNKYLTETEPWKLQKSDPQRTETILFNCAQIVAMSSVALEPFLPYTARKLREGLGIERADWKAPLQDNLLRPGHSIGQLPILFEKITDEQVAFQVEKLHASREKVASQAKPIKDAVDFELFQKMDLRIVRVVAAEKVPKTKKLLKLTVNTGMDERTVVSGIAEHYTPEEMVGKDVLYLANLAPRDIKGITSHGMILMGENAAGVLSALSPEKPLNPGDEVR
jgi:methionyl-tRNA synthetase